MRKLQSLIHLTICLSTIGAHATDAIEQLEVTPTKLTLTGSRATAQLIVTGRLANGDVRDLTNEAEYTSPEFVGVAGGFVASRMNGSGTIRVQVGSIEQTVDIVVEHFERPLPISFRWEALAILTKQGCNSGSCHGKPNGRGSLELSLNAFDPTLDERSLIRGSMVRFAQPIQPDESLLLKKPTLRVPHGGGKRLRKNDVGYAILRQWIFDGCQPDPPDEPVCVEVQVSPDSGRLLRLPARQQVRVAARFSNGAVRDVTRISTYTVSDSKVAEVDANGVVTGLDRGQTAIVVRYLDEIVSVNFTFVRDIDGFEWNDAPENNFVDTLVHQKLKQLQYLPSGQCDDWTFIRRLSLDVRGLLPSVAETSTFLAETAPDKRARLIDRYLMSSEYARFQGLRLADLLRINRERLSQQRATEYSRWVFDTVERNMPYDQFVRELLTATGRTSENQAANFYRTTTDTKMVTETVAQLFMGSRVMCAQCHNHPYESWTQDNYYQIGAAFHEVDRKLLELVDDNGKKKKQDARNRLMEIAMTSGRGMANPRTGVVQKPWPTDIDRAPDADKRTAFVAWLTRPGNPYFARVAVNRIWSHLMGRGLVTPIDDFRSSNPAVNIGLLDALAHEFEETGFDRRHIVRLILNSRAYQRSSETNRFNETDRELSSHYRVRMLSAEQMQDAIQRLCHGVEAYEQLVAEFKTARASYQSVLSASQNSNSQEVVAARSKQDAARAKIESYCFTQQPYPAQTTFLQAFGQPKRETACACERREEASLDQALQLMNSSLVRDQVAAAGRRLETLSNEDLVTELYLAAFSREPRDDEMTTLERHLGSSTNRRQTIEDVAWALINTNEFMFQH